MTDPIDPRECMLPGSPWFGALLGPVAEIVSEEEEEERE